MKTQKTQSKKAQKQSVQKNTLEAPDTSTFGEVFLSQREHFPTSHQEPSQKPLGIFTRSASYFLRYLPKLKDYQLFPDEPVYAEGFGSDSKLVKLVKLTKFLKTPVSPKTVGLVSLFIAVCIVALTGMFVFTSIKHIDQSFVINSKNVTTRLSTQVVATQPIKWVAIVNRKDITNNNYLLQLPKTATHIKVTNTAPIPTQLTLQDRMKLARVFYTPNSGLASLKDIVMYFLSSAKDGADNIVEDIKDKVKEKVKEKDQITETEDAKIVDLSKEEKQAEKEQKEQKQEEKNPSDDSIKLSETPVPATPAEVSDASAPSDDGVPLVDTTSPADQPVVELGAEVAQTSDVASATSAEDVVQVEYETPAPIIAEQDTHQGKLVTVSSTSGVEQAPLTNVIAFTTIPEIYKAGQENLIKIKWKNNNGQDMPFIAFDLNNNGKIDYLEWTIPHLSDQIFEIIFISKAWELDENKEIVADIYDTVATQDGIWATVPDGHYVRATFEQILDNTNDITIHAKPQDPNSNAQIEIYAGDEFIAEVNVNSENTYRTLLTNLTTPTDTFDLKITGNIDIDYIVDPTPATVTDNFIDTTKIASSANLTVDTTGGTVSLSTATSWSCGSALTDSRDGKTYATVLIGSQCWMAGNLNYAPGGQVNGGVTQSGYSGTTCGSVTKWCYSDIASNCTTYGGLYQWAQMMCGSTTPGVQGICPSSWHIPTHDEWTTLERTVCALTPTDSFCAAQFPYNTTTSGSYQGTTTEAMYTKLYSGGSSGFNGLLAGIYNGGFTYLGSFTYFWSSLQSGSFAWDRHLYSSYAGVNRNTYAKANGFSVRCLKN